MNKLKDFLLEMKKTMMAGVYLLALVLTFTNVDLLKERGRTSSLHQALYVKPAARNNHLMIVMKIVTAMELKPQQISQVEMIMAMMPQMTIMAPMVVMFQMKIMAQMMIMVQAQVQLFIVLLLELLFYQLFW